MKKTKAAAIREALQETTSPAEVAAKLKKQGLDVRPDYVSLIKIIDRKRSKPRPASSTRVAHGYNELILKSVELVSAVGVDEAQRLITVAAEIVEYINASRR